MASSVRTGRDLLPVGASGVIVALCDYPLISPATIAALVSAHSDHPQSVIIPVHNNRRGHPTLFPATALDELGEAVTLRDLVRRDPARLRLLEVSDPGILLDMDTPGDYSLLQQHVAKG